jgi:ketosteroid isomerase-like protein
MDIATFNSEWLKAWTDKDTPRVLSFYHPEAVYRDNQVPSGITGHVALGAYLGGLFAATPPMRYEPDETWTTPDGYCGRWICTMDVPDGTKRYLRGFDLVVMRDQLIGLNEVYTHNLPGKPLARAH